MLSKKELENIALLSKLEISKESFDHLLNDMKNILEFVNKIESVDLNDESFYGFDGLENRFRSDNVVNSFERDEILKNCNMVDEGFFSINLNSIEGRQ